MDEREVIITNKNKLEAKHVSHEPYEYYKYEVTKGAGLSQCYAAIYEIPPGKTNIPYHYHLKNEEVFYIISGRGEVETADGPKAISAGDVMVCPPTEKGAHKITNTSDTEKLVYIDFDTIEPARGGLLPA